MNNKILIYGCGENSNRFIKNDFIDLDSVYGFIDNFREIDNFYGKPVYKIKEAIKILNKVDYILVTVQNFKVNKEIFNTLKSSNYPMEKILFVYNTEVSFDINKIHEQNDLLIRDISMQVYDSEVSSKSQKICIAKNSYDAIDKKCCVGNGKLIDDKVYLADYSRYRTFEFCMEEINKLYPKQGNFAELGVFQGVFSALINEKCPQRKLYLYDTFESFDKKEYIREVENKNCPKGFYNGFKETNVQLVLGKMKYPNQCIIRKGLFPQSIMEDDKKEKFVFVSLDVDFENSTYEGLKFFYPRLLEGGYIFVHDYHNHCLFGVKNAIEKFEKEEGIKLKKVPISDEGGTLIITK